jgi:hypothetical protein
MPEVVDGDAPLVGARERFWREAVLEAQRKYLDNKNSETKQEFLRVLKIFTALVTQGEIPLE